MRNDATRTYRIDIETDSTLSATQDSDMQGLREVLTACSQMLQGFGPAVQMGAMPVDVLKALMLAVVRRAKLGSAVEDALEKMQQPPPAQDPNAGKVQAQMQIEQMKSQMADQQHQREMQYNAQAEQQSAQLKAQVERDKQEAQAQQNAHQNAMEQQREQQQMQNEAALEQMRIASDERVAQIENNLALLIAQMGNAAKIEVAEIAANTTLQSAQISAAKQAESAP
jgi:ferritin-like metal-binding protein YciE